MRHDQKEDPAPSNPVSIHAPREGCDHQPLALLWLTKWFQFTHPGRGATKPDRAVVVDRSRFNSRTPGGVRLQLSARYGSYSTGFNSRTPGGVRHTRDFCQASSICFNSRTPGGVRLRTLRLRVTRSEVSIHAPREGCDEKGLRQCLHRRQVSIHAPREGCDEYKDL